MDGYDLDEIAPRLEPEFTAFVACRHWRSGKAWVVNQRGKKEGRSEDLARWDFGLNLELPGSKEEQAACFPEVEEIAAFLRGISEKIQREFVVGAADTQTKDTWDFAFIDGGPVNIERIANALGVTPK